MGKPGVPGKGQGLQDYTTLFTHISISRRSSPCRTDRRDDGCGHRVVNCESTFSHINIVSDNGSPYFLLWKHTVLYSNPSITLDFKTSICS